MATVFVGSHLLANAPRVTVRFEQEDGRTLGAIRGQFGQPDAELRELQSIGHGERRHANRTNPDYRVQTGKEYELVIPGRRKGWSKDVCRNASQLVAHAVNLPEELWERPAELVNSPLSILVLLVLRMCRLVVAAWMFTLGLVSTGCTMPMQVIYHLFSVSLQSIAPAYFCDLPTLGHTPRFVFIAVSCFLALAGTAVVFLLLLLSLLSQMYMCMLELMVRVLGWLLWVILVCFGVSGFTDRRPVDLIFFLVSLPWLQGVTFMSAEFVSRLTYLFSSYLLMVSRQRISALVARRPAGSPEYRSALLQHAILWSFPALALVTIHFRGFSAAVGTCWALVSMSLVVPYVVEGARRSRRPPS